MIFGTRNGEIILQDINDLKNVKNYSVEKYESLLEPPCEMMINPKNTVILF